MCEKYCHWTFLWILVHISGEGAPKKEKRHNPPWITVEDRLSVYNLLSLAVLDSFYRREIPQLCFVTEFSVIDFVVSFWLPVAITSGCCSKNGQYGRALKPCITNDMDMAERVRGPENNSNITLEHWCRVEDPNNSYMVFEFMECPHCIVRRSLSCRC